jgi:hypothetical protein
MTRHSMYAGLIVLGLGTAVPAFADPPVSTGANVPQDAKSAITTTMNGRLLKLERDAVIISTGGGGQARLQVNPETKIDGAPKAGDEVEAGLALDKHVVVLKVLRPH